MKFYFDESGEFSIPKNQEEHAVAVVMGIAISDLIENKLEEEYKKFVSSLESYELKNNEPKGYLLTNEKKHEFCDMLSKFDGISITPVTLDLSSLADSVYTKLNEIFSSYLKEYSKKMKYKQARRQLLLLSKQFNNLSVQQALRIYSIVNCFREALEHSILFLSNRGHEFSWNNIKCEIDRVYLNPNNREEKVLSFVIFAWLCGWSISHPFSLIKEIHTKEHPFVKKYDTGNGIDIAKLLRNNIYWEDSKNNWGLQIADIASNIVFKACCSLWKNKENLILYSSLMRSSHYGAKRGPGLFSPLSSDLTTEVRMKYKPLSDAMKARKID